MLILLSLLFYARVAVEQIELHSPYPQALTGNGFRNDGETVGR